MSLPKPPSFNQVISYLDNLEKFGINQGLERMELLLSALGNPHQNYSTILVGGTNGKTTTARIIWNILKAHGLKTGLYTSPHLSDYRERIMLDNQLMEENEFTGLFEEVHQKAEEINQKIRPDFVTQFELITTMAFYYFYKKKVDLVVLEVGLGGRLDATNVVSSKVSVLTSVSLEHTKHLGNTIASIAQEKAAIIKEGSVIIGSLPAEAVVKVENKSKKEEATLYQPGRDFQIKSIRRDDSGQFFSLEGIKGKYKDIYLPLKGKFQVENAAIAIVAAEAFLDSELSLRGLNEGFGKLVSTGRMEILQDKPLIIADGAHNPGGFEKLFESLAIESKKKKIITILAILDDKDAKKMMEIAAGFSEELILTANQSYRSYPVEKLVELLPSGKKFSSAKDVGEAIKMANQKAGPEDVILITGSLTTVAEAISFYRHKTEDIRQKT